MRRRILLVLCVLISGFTVVLWVMSYRQAPGVCPECGTPIPERRPTE